MLVLRAVFLHIVANFNSSSFYSLRDLRVHTDKKAFEVLGKLMSMG